MGSDFKIHTTPTVHHNSIITFNSSDYFHIEFALTLILLQAFKELQITYE